MTMMSTARAGSELYLPYTLAVMLEADGIQPAHVQLLLQDSAVMQRLHFLDQVRRNISANPNSDLPLIASRIQQAQQQLSRQIAHAWQEYPPQRQCLENPQTLLALIDALRCTQP